MNELSPGESTPLVAGWDSEVEIAASPLGGDAPPLAAAASALALRFFADLDSIGTVPVVDMVVQVRESVCGVGKRSGVEATTDWFVGQGVFEPKRVARKRQDTGSCMRR